jgi:Rha family phage regulatory protein
MLENIKAMVKISKKNHVVVDSLRLSTVLNRRHDNVLRDIHKIIDVYEKDHGVDIDPMVIGLSSYADRRNITRSRYLLSKQGFKLFMVGYRGSPGDTFKRNYLGACLKAFDDKQSELLRAVTIDTSFMDDNGDSEVTFSADICSEAGFAEGDYEVSFMDDIPAGNTMDEEATVASFLDDYPAGDAMDEEALIASFLDDTPACDPVDNTFDFKSLVRVDNNGQVIATSLGVAKRFGKRHDNVLAAIREIIAKNVECEETRS